MRFTASFILHEDPMSRLARLLLVLIAGVVLSAAAAGCGKKPPPAPVTPAPTPPPPPPPPPPAPPSTPEVLSEDEVFRRKSLADITNEVESVYFDYDSAELSEAARASLQKTAEYLKKWSSTKANVEGHCDARGSSEYNLGLGERRASAVRNYMLSLGIPADRLMAVSKGEEQPQCTEESDSCWEKNRRGKFVFTSK
jgi:peptidoglycan-associated lipoprotein